MSTSPGYNCTLCARFHPYTPYVMAHPNERLTHRCMCGATHDLINGHARLVDRMAKPSVTEWITDDPPVREGYYHIRFPNGTESDRNWHWNGLAFGYDKNSPHILGFTSIAGWRGLDRRYE
jgi:hypothetical protein